VSISIFYQICVKQVKITLQKYACDQTSVHTMPHKSVSFTILILLFSLFYYGINLFWGRGLWVEDEARYGEVIRETIQNGRWLVPHLNAVPYPDKPPLYFWLGAVSSKISGGLSPALLRFITLITVLFTLVSFYFLALLILDRKTSFLAVLILMSSFIFVLCGNIVRMDMLLCCFVVISIFFFYRDYKRKGKFILFYVFAICAFIVKGPLGFLFPFLFGITYLYKKKEKISVMHIGRGLFMLFALLLVWVGLVYWSGNAAYLNNILFKQIIGRTVKSWSHQRSFFFYTLIFPLIFFPWFPFVFRAVMEMRDTNRELYIFCFSWFVPGFLLISIISGKLLIYPLPLIPALCLPLSVFLGDVIAQRKKNISLRAESLFILFVYAALALGVPIAAYILFPKAMNSTVIFSMSLCLVCWSLFCNIKQENWKGVIMASFCGAFCFSVFGFGLAASRLDPYFNGAALGKKIREYKNNGYFIASVDIHSGIFCYASRTTFPEWDMEYLQAKFKTLRNPFIITRKKALRKLPPSLAEYTYVSGTYGVAGIDYVTIERVGK